MGERIGKNIGRAMFETPRRQSKKTDEPLKGDLKGEERGLMAEMDLEG